MKSGSLNFLEHSEPLQACNGTAFRHFLTSSYDPIKRFQNYKKQFFYGQNPVLGSLLISLITKSNLSAKDYTLDLGVQSVDGNNNLSRKVQPSYS
jgi:hypothetical protein